MSKLKDLFISLSLFILGILIWGYKTIITSDIAISISLKEFINLCNIIFIYTALQYFYIQKLKSKLYTLNLLLIIILLLLWFVSLITALIYNYNKYDTIIDIISFISIIIIFYIKVLYKK